MTFHRLTKHLTRCITVLLCCVVLGFFGQFSVKHYMDAQVEVARYSTQTAYFAEQSSRHETMKEYLALESKRTTVQVEIRRIVIAEWKKCRKGKC